jgi:hypothetical protein
VKRSKGTRSELEAALAQVRSSKTRIRGITKRQSIANLEARIAACSVGGVADSRIAAVRARERERIDRLVDG